MKAIIQIDVPDHQIGQEVSIYFKDTMMIKGIVQEPCDDAISRQAVFSVTDGISVSVTGLCTEVNELQSVNPQEPCEDEYIKVPKKALKYRTAGMVAYNVEWLKNHFDIERAVICGAQEPKTGHWKRNETIRLTYCSECGFGQHIDEFRTYNYCPNCGCRMVEPRESEDKE